MDDSTKGSGGLTPKETQTDVKSTITFSINGESFSVTNEYDPATSLLEFMRQSGVSVGTKGCCYEGGCGVCLVTVKLLDPLTGNKRSYSLNSCCLQLYTCDGMEITTVEGLGNTSAGLHPIQQRIASMNGIQCGYCTPGQIMNMYGLLQSNPTPSMKDVEDAFDSTICRCTGYRPILDAMKSFASDAPSSISRGIIDIEELDGKLCRKTNQACVGHCGTKDCDNRIAKPVHIVAGRAQWFKPLNLAELCPLLQQYVNYNYRLVFGNTGFGVYKDVGPWNYNILIDIRGMNELYTVDLTPSDHIVVGANLTLTNLKELLAKNTDPELPYASNFVDHLQFTASNGIRNLGSWAGNLALKHQHPDFVSDVLILLETVGANLNIVDSSGLNKLYTLDEFFALDMKAKVIVSMQLPKYNASSQRSIRTIKTSHRLQQCQAHVASGFNFELDANNNFLVKSKPSIVIQGISGSLIHAVQTESYLINKQLGDPTVLAGALSSLSAELVPETSPTSASASYRKSLALGHFYKFVLEACKTKCDVRYVTGGPGLDRPLMTATQSYGTDDPTVYPATKPMPKFTAYNLATGEVKFLTDLPVLQGQLYAAPVLSTMGNARLASVDASAALNIPGVVKFIQAADIPGENNWRPKPLYEPGAYQELLSSGEILYAGQPIGIVVATDEITAQGARGAVKVTYSDVQPSITGVEEAIQKKSFYPKLGPFTAGDPAAAMASAPHRISGSIHSTDQYNFHLESQAAFCSPSDLGGMDVLATSQWLDATSETVAQLLGIQESSINVEIQRLGGGFGGKIFYNLPVAGMCAVAAQVTKRPVLMSLDLHTNMQFQGKRTRYVYQYEIGFDDDGKILAIIATAYSDSGPIFLKADCNEGTQNYIDSAYFCPNWSWTVQPCKTNKPVPTSVRAPGTAPAIYAMECMIDHVATYLKKDHLEVRKLNLFVDGQTTLGGLVLENCLIRDLVHQLETDIDYPARVQAVNDFNKANRWRKRGLHVMPIRYSLSWNKFIHHTTVVVHHGDGSVAISHGGVDMGQGINTKAIQCCAYKLGVPVDKIKIKKTSSFFNANSHWTAATVTSELICLAVMTCCDMLLERMAPVKAKLVNPTWEEIVEQCFKDMVDLTASYLNHPEDKVENARYNCWSACCTEVELDTITGQYQINQVDFLYDCGISLNPDIDLGQLEGGFMMGCGLFLLEGMTFDPVTGKALTDGTWTYKPPLAKDLPIKFNVKFLRNSPNPYGLLRSKAVGEVPVAQGACPLLALKRAVEAARFESGIEGWFQFSAPASVEQIQVSCLNDVKNFTFGHQE
ncbi:xanthine dehydrogenase-like [Physella acuta]|uniref:xanthine dehydrogenase-like n=1 Tax=Physella acuta TaxID=109671 RepID=UPI0027DDAE7B|nr:xanthine dehydrogenase-like [Physella acuta]